MGMNPRTLRPGSTFTPRSISGLALWLDAADSSTLYTTDAGPVTAVSSPTEISGLRTWWDFSDASTLFQNSDGTVAASSAGDRVGYVKDKVGSSNLTQATSNLRGTVVASGIGGRRCVSLPSDATSGWDFTGAALSSATWFIVAKYTGTANWITVHSGANYVIDAIADGSADSAFATSGTPSYRVNGVSQAGVRNTLHDAIGGANVPYLLTATSVSHFTWPTAANAWSLGRYASTFNFIGEFGEILWFDGTLSATDRARVEAYLAAKWGFSGVHRPVEQEIAAVVSPTAISGCTAWWDFSDSSSLSVTSGNIDSCNDKSGRNFHLSSSSTNRPTLAAAIKNGLNAAEFDGVNDLMTATFSGTYTAATVFAVVYPDTAGGGSLGRILTRGASNLAYDGTNTALRYNAPFTGATGNGGQRTANGSAAQDQWHLASFTWNGGLNVATDITPYLSGVTSNAALTGTGDAVSTTGINDFILGNRSLADGADRGWDGYIGEIIIFNVALAATDRARVEKYLAAKWGIANVPDPTPPVGYWGDKSGNGRHATQATGASRPTVSATALNGRRQLGLVSQHLRGPSTSWNGSASIYWVGRTGQATSGAIVFGDGTPDQADGFHAGWLNTAGVGAYGNGWNSGNAPRAESPSAWRNADIVAGVTLSSTESLARVNGATTSATALTGTLSQASAAQFYVGRESSGTWNNLNGSLAELLIYQPALSASQRARLERYLASKWNITLAPQVSNADAQDWINRVYANGGTVSATTATAVNTFCDAIDTAGIRDRFYRLNLFCGNNLSAALVPLYRNTSLSGSPLGNATDTNAGGVFVSGDYNEIAGLTPTFGGAKHLDTGLTPDAMPLSVVQAMHLAGSHGPIPASASAITPYLLGAANGGTDRHFIQVAVAPSGTPAVSAPLGKANAVVSATLPAGAQPSASWIASRTSATSLVLYKNGTSNGTLTTSITGIASYGRAFTVCRVNFTGSIIGDSHNFPHRHYSIGAGLTAAQAAAYESALAAFRTALGRTA